MEPRESVPTGPCAPAAALGLRYPFITSTVMHVKITALMPLGAHTFSGLECTRVPVHAKSDFLNGFKWLERSINYLQKEINNWRRFCVSEICVCWFQRSSNIPLRSFSWLFPPPGEESHRLPANSNFPLNILRVLEWLPKVLCFDSETMLIWHSLPNTRKYYNKVQFPRGNDVAIHSALHIYCP